MMIKMTIFTHRPHVSRIWFLSWWWHHNQLLMMSQWPDNCGAITFTMISNSLDIYFIHGNIHGLSCKKTWSNIAVTLHELHGIWNHHKLDCLFNILSRHTTKKTSKLYITGSLVGEFLLWEGNPLVVSPHKGPLMWKVFLYHNVIKNIIQPDTQYFVQYCKVSAEICPDFNSLAPGRFQFNFR